MSVFPKESDDLMLRMTIERQQARIDKLEAAIRQHRDQKADDRCWEDDERLYDILGGEKKADHRVGDKLAMVKNCIRFIETRCVGGLWPTYVELEAQVNVLNKRAQLAEEKLETAQKAWDLSFKFQERTIARLKKELLQEQMGHDTHRITHEFVLRRVYKKGERTLVPEESLGCGHILEDTGSIEGPMYCRRPLSEHPIIVRNYRDGAIDE